MNFNLFSINYDKHIVQIFMVLSGSFFLGACSTRSHTGGNSPASEYPVLELVRKSVSIHNEFPVTLQGMQDIEMRLKIEGYIDKIYVSEGATVKKGQLLFHIRNNEYEDDVTGLTTCQARSENKLDFHFNAALTAVNLAKYDWITGKYGTSKPFPMADYFTDRAGI